MWCLLTKTAIDCRPRPKIRVPVLLGAALLLDVAPVAQGGEGKANSLAALRAEVEKHLAQPRFAHAQFGVHAVSLETGRILCETNADKLFVPASTTKLFTAALALDRFGPDYRIATSLYGTAKPDARGRLHGDLVLVGRGDPSLEVAALGGDWDRALEPLVSAVLAAGVREIRGDLVADATYLQGSPFGSGWEYDDLTWYYGAAASALTVNNNAVELTVRPARRPGLPVEAFLFPATRYVVVSNFARTAAADAVFVPGLQMRRRPEANVIEVWGALAADAAPAKASFAVRHPAKWLAQEFREALRRRGVKLGGRLAVAGGSDTEDRLAHERAPLYELGSVLSPSLGELLPRMLKPSQNLQAQLWLLQAGAARPGRTEADVTTEQAGLEELEGFLKGAGIDPAAAHFEEGSGLSRHNLVTPQSLVALLRHMYGHRASAAFLAALPVAGVDGTLRQRMRGTPAEGNVRAKTGTLSGVYALAGYVTTGVGEPVAFAVMLNHYAPPAERPGRLELDEVAVALAGLRQHSREEVATEAP